MTRRTLRSLGTLLVSGACTAYVIWKIDIRRTIEILSNADAAYFLSAVAVIILAIAPMAWRWQQLLAARGLRDRLGWLTRTYYVSYAIAQVLPTSLGGDAARIVSTSRRHRGSGEVVTGSVLIERALGAGATLVLAAIGFVLAIGRYNVGAYLWIEAVIGGVSLVAAVVVFSRRARRPLSILVPIFRFARLERPLRAAYEGVHRYRNHIGVVATAFALTLVVQAFRVAAIWMLGKSVGVNLSPRPYYVMGPMLFLVMLVPFTINGIALREAFFVSFLTKLDVSPDAAFATGFLFFLTGVLSATPGALILAIEAIGSSRTRPRRTPETSEN